MLEMLMQISKKSYPDNVKFLGEIAVGDLINGNQLAAMVEYTTGTSQYPTEPWLAWEIDGKTVLYSKRPYRHTVGWQTFSAAGIVNDTQRLVLRGKEYFIGLPKGVNPLTSTGAVEGYDVPYSHNSEWNRLLYPITIAAGKDSQIGPNQANYSETALSLGGSGGNGRFSICREVHKSGSNLRPHRGGGGVTYLGSIGTQVGGAEMGWRPRLELIGNSLPSGVFLGEVPVSELITGDALAAAVGLTVGLSQYSSEPWLKWEIDGKIVYYAKKPYRYNVSWDNLNNAGIVRETRTVTIQGKKYLIGLPQGVNPAAGNKYSGGQDAPMTHNSEWNRLMYPITSSDAMMVSQHGPKQASYTETDVGAKYGVGYGTYTLCRDAAMAPVSTSNRILRGVDSISGSSNAASNQNQYWYGWRPRLELVS